MDIREWLSQYRRYTKPSRKAEQANAIRSRLTSCTTRWQQMPKSHTANNTIEDALVRLIDLEREIDDERKAQRKTMSAIKQVIEFLPDYRHRIILECRYMHGMTWSRVQEHLDNKYDMRHVFRMHGRALQQANIVRTRLAEKDTMSASVWYNDKVDI